MRRRKKKTASLVVINYLELVESDLPGQGFVETMKRNLEVLESTAESTQIPILVAQHTLRRLGHRPGPWFGECFSREWQIGSDVKGLKEGFLGRRHPLADSFKSSPIDRDGDEQVGGRQNEE